MKNVVLDTSVVAAGLRTRLGAGNALLQLAAGQRIVLLATPPLFLEYEEVLKRPEQQVAHRLTPELVDRFLAELTALIQPVEVHFWWHPQMRDSSDEIVLEAAVHGSAEAIVTYNVDDFLEAGKRFDVGVLSPAELFRKFK